MAVRTVAVAGAAGLLLAASAFGSPTSGAAATVPASSSASAAYSVTLVARVCTNYSDIMANRARNDIQESLQDLGANTVYSAGQPVDPSIETANDPNCTALNGVTFTFGTAYQKTGQYSTVTASNPAVDGVTSATAPGTPLLDAQGNPTGATIDGATNYTLNAAQIAQASRNNQLWLQGGTRASPLPPRTGGGSYGFGALRCAIDNLNGDNVEWVGFPAAAPAARHVFCYAYYIDIPPPQGTIVIRKELTAGSDVSQGFTFASNATYNPSGTFGLQVTGGAPAQTTFIRAASSAFGSSYTFEEDTTDLDAEGWTLTSVVCTGPGATIVANVVSIDLQAGTTVTCVWTDDPPHDPGLTVRKVSVGGVGTFPIVATRLTDQNGNPVVGPVLPLTATTTSENMPVDALPVPGAVAAGTWQLVETLPVVPGGSWSVTQAYCNQRSVAVSTPAPGSRSLTVVLPVNGGADCTFVNTFTPVGALTINLITHGGTSTGGFVVTTLALPQLHAADDPDGLNQSATTTTPGAPATASGDPTDALSLGSYNVLSTPPQPVALGRWSFVSFGCIGAPTTSPQPGAVVVGLSAAAPSADCTAVYDLLPLTSLQVRKTLSGDPAGRSGDVIVTVDCLDGSAGTVVGPAGQAGPFDLPTPLVFAVSTSCTVQESDTGAAPGAHVTTTAILTTPAGSSSVRLPAVIPIDSAATGYSIAIDNSYDPAALAPTGTTPIGAGVAAAAALLLGTGLVAARRRVARSVSGRRDPRP